jgi:hypothetical protein
MSWSRGPARQAEYNRVTFRSGLICEAPEDLELPMFIEVKPAELLYALRDHVGCPERFDGTRWSAIDCGTMYKEGLEEVWKPKALAELYQTDVLITAKLNATSSLSIMAKPTGIELSKSHPAVNRRGVLAQQERERQWAESEARQAAWRAQREAELAAQAEVLLTVARRANRRPAGRDDWCRYCRTQQPAALLDIFRQPDSPYWDAICRSHL